jgi:hypothetical protein
MLVTKGKRIDLYRFSDGFLIKSNLICYRLSPWNRVLLQKLIVAELVKKFTAFYESRRTSAMSTRAGFGKVT